MSALNGSSTSHVNFAAVASAALARARDLLPRWFPHGQMQGNEFRIGNVRGDPGQSLSINLQTGIWKDFNSDSGEAGGDMISLRAAMDRINQGDAAQRVMTDLGLHTPGMGSRANQTKSAGDQRDRKRREQQDADRQVRQAEQAAVAAKRAAKIDGARRDAVAPASVPISDKSGELGARYLHSRCIPTPAAGWPECVRFHVAKNALLVAATTEAGVTQAIQVVYLDDLGEKLDREDCLARRLPLKAKQSFGPQDGACVRLPGDPAGPLLFAEGPETALSAFAVTEFETRISLGSIGKLEPPAGRKVVVLRDDDAEGSDADRSLLEAVNRWRREGHDISIATPWATRRGDESDFNDLIRADGPDAVAARIQLALNTKEADTKAPLPLLWLEDIEPVLEAKDFVQGVLCEGGAAVVYGDSNAGKTFWTSDLSLHVAGGKTWNGRRVDQGGVVYCVLEGGNGFRNRVAAWRATHTTPGVKLPFAAVPLALNLLDPAADTPALIETIQAAAKQMGQPVKLVVIDTLSRALAGGDENSSQDMGALVGNMDAIRAATGACVLFVHHSGKDAAKGARGHSLLRAAVDTEIEVKADDETGQRTATVVKQRELAKGARFGFRLDLVVLGQNQHGEDVTTCTVSGQEPADKLRRQETKLTDEEQGWLRDITDFFATPDQVQKRVTPVPGMVPVRGATRNEIRVWLQERGRLGVAPVASGVASDNALSATDRSRLLRNLNKLKDRGKLGVTAEWIWLP